MDEIKEEHFSLICRLCLNDKPERLINLADDDQANLLYRIQTMADINIYETPYFPQKVCNVCLKKVHDFYGFIMICKHSEKLLNEKFPYLINENKLNHEFFPVFIKESRIDTEPRDPELIAIKEELLECPDVALVDETHVNNKETQKDSNHESDTSSSEEFDTKIDATQVINDEMQKDSIQERSEEFKPKPKCLDKSESKVSKDKRSAKKKYVKRLYPCQFCGKTYDKWRLESHLNVHNNIRPFKCQFEDCDKSFCKSKSLVQHQHTHSRINLKCDICQNVYQSIRSLDTHKRRHRDPHIPCGQCDMKFKTTKCLNQHMMKHTGERNFSCEFCPKTFATAYNLKVHLRIHTGDKPFTCKPCGVSFAYNSLMKAHNEKNHPES